MNTPTQAPVWCYFLGTFRLEREGVRLPLARRKTEALLAYLVLHPQPHAREKIAALFWATRPMPMPVDHSA